MGDFTVGLIGVAAFLVLMALRTPISIAMGITGFAGYAYLVSPNAAFRLVIQDIFTNFSNYSLSIIPLFVWMGFIAFHSGLGSKLYTFAYNLIGHWPGGLAIASQVACAVFGAICGSNTATAATMGSIAVPEMKKYKYDASLSTASVASAGALGILIPPSVIFVVYGIATGQPISRLFMAGIIPGILLMTFYIITIYIITLRDPSLGPAGTKKNFKEIAASFSQGLPEIFAVFILSIGGLFKGWFTPSEAGAVGAGGILLVNLIRGNLSWRAFNLSLIDTTRTTAMIMFLVAGAVIFGRFMAVARIPFELANWVSALALPAYMVMALVIFIYLVLGMFIDALALVLLTIPIFYPVVVDTLGYDPIWFGVIIVMIVALGVITPPVGMNVYIIKGVVPDIPLETIFRGVWPFVIALLLCIALLIAFPQLILFLPNLLS